MSPGDLIRPKRNQHVAIWKQILWHKVPVGIRYSMKDQVGNLEDIALVIAVPGFMGAGSKDASDGAVCLFTSDCKFRWAWAGSLMVL